MQFLTISSARYPPSQLCSALVFGAQGQCASEHHPGCPVWVWLLLQQLEVIGVDSSGSSWGSSWGWRGASCLEYESQTKLNGEGSRLLAYKPMKVCKYILANMVLVFQEYICATSTDLSLFQSCYSIMASPGTTGHNSATSMVRTG